MNKILKIRGGISGITCKENSRNRHFLVAPILESISEEMPKAGGGSYLETKTHHELKPSHTNRQNINVSSLLEVFDNHNLTFASDDDIQMRNIITGQVFTDEVFRGMINCEDTGKAMYNDIVIERLQPDSKVDIFAPLKKANVKTCKTANKNRKMKVHNKIVFARCAVIKGKRDIDMKIVVGDYELMTVPRSLMKPDGTLLSGHIGKADLVKEVLKEFCVTPAETLNLCPDDTIFVVIDAMHIVNKINPKPAWIKTGDDLAKVFTNHIDIRSQNASTVVIVFDTYRDLALKPATRDNRTIGK